MLGSFGARDTESQGSGSRCTGGSPATMLNLGLAHRYLVQRVYNIARNRNSSRPMHIYHRTSRGQQPACVLQQVTASLMGCYVTVQGPALECVLAHWQMGDDLSLLGLGYGTAPSSLEGNPFRLMERLGRCRLLRTFGRITRGAIETAASRVLAMNKPCTCCRSRFPMIVRCQRQDRWFRTGIARLIDTIVWAFVFWGKTGPYLIGQFK